MVPPITADDLFPSRYNIGFTTFIYYIAYNIDSSFHLQPAIVSTRTYNQNYVYIMVIAIRANQEDRPISYNISILRKLRNA